MSDHSQPVPVGSGVTPHTRANLSSVTAGHHTQLRPTSDHSQPVPVGSGVIPPAHATSASGTTASQLRPTSDYRHEHLSISLGVIPSPRTDLAPSPTAPPNRSLSDHSHLYDARKVAEMKGNHIKNAMPLATIQLFRKQRAPTKLCAKLLGMLTYKDPDKQARTFSLASREVSIG